MSRVMRRATPRRLTWSRVGVTICVALIAFGAVVALLPRHVRPAAGAGACFRHGSRATVPPTWRLQSW